MRRQRCGIQAQRFDRRQHRAQIAAVVAPGQRHVLRIEHGTFAAIDHILAQMPTVGDAETAHFAVRQRQRSQRAVVAVEDRDMRLGIGQQREFVLDIARFAAVPIQMLGKNIGRNRDVGPHAGRCDVTGLVARQFDRPELRRLLNIEQLQQRHADVAAEGCAVAAGAQQMREQRGRRAFAFGAGDADRARIGIFGEPQRSAADEMRTALRRDQGFGPVRADAGRFHHHVERRQTQTAGVGIDRQ